MTWCLSCWKARTGNLWFDRSHGSRVRYKFKYTLEGYDENWIDAGTRRIAHDTSIPPEHYGFQVMACNNGRVWSETR